MAEIIPLGPCAYWPDEPRQSGEERIIPVRVSEHLSDDKRREIKFEKLPHGIIPAGYTLSKPNCPACPTHQKCIPVRINNEQFQMSPSQRGKLSRFHRIADVCTTNSRSDNEEARTLFQKYQENRFDKRMEKGAFTSFFNRNTANSSDLLLAYWKDTKNLLAGAFIDYADQDSWVHTDTRVERFFYDTDPKIMRLSPGLSMLLHVAADAKERFPQGNFYLGSWSLGSPKLDYKRIFYGHGLEFFHDGQWQSEPPDAIKNHPDWLIPHHEMMKRRRTLALPSHPNAP